MHCVLWYMQYIYWGGGCSEGVRTIGLYFLFFFSSDPEINPVQYEVGSANTVEKSGLFHYITKLSKIFAAAPMYPLALM